MHEMAQQRLRTAESSLAGQAQEAYNKSVADMNLVNEAEAMQAKQPRRPISEFEAKMNDMANLMTQRKATNERQRVEYESQLHRNCLLSRWLPLLVGQCLHKVRQSLMGTWS